MKRLILPAVLPLIVLLAACGAKPSETSSSDPGDPVLQGTQLRFPAGHPQLAQLGLVEAKSARDLDAELPARFVWNEDRTQRLYAPFAGRVERIVADVGQAVKPGSVLALLASPEFGAAQADTAKAQADLQLAQRALARQKELFEAGVTARKDLEQAEADAARAAAEAQRAQARTRLYGGQGGVDQRLALTAGISGVVVERNLTPSQELRPDQSGAGVPPLFVVSDPSSLWVTIDAREIEVDALRVGASFELDVPSLPGQKFTGRVMAAGDFIDPATRTLRVRGIVDNPQRKLKAEMLATARIKRNVPNAVVVPAGAVKLEGTRHSVIVQVAPGLFEMRDIAVLHQGQTQALISSGLKAGEQVVHENMLLVARQFRMALDAARPAAPAASSAASTPASTPASSPASAARVEAAR